MKKVRTISEQDLLPLPLVQLSHKYSLSLSTYMREVEAVLGDLWKEELGNHMLVKNVAPYQDCSARNSQDQILPRFSTFLNINKLTKEPSCSQVHKISYKSSRSSPSLTRLPTSQDQEVPRYNWLNCSQLEDSGISSSSSMDSMSCLVLSKKKSKMEEKTDSTHLARHYSQVRTHSLLASVVTGQHSGQVYCDQNQILPSLW